jgi:hypothetical protein
MLEPVLLAAHFMPALRYSHSSLNPENKPADE